MTHYIYFFGRKEGPVKIGCTTNPKLRRSSLQVASPFKFDFEAFMDIDEPNATVAHGYETAIHADLSHKRLNGEWFDTPGEDALASAVKTLEQLGMTMDRISEDAELPAINRDLMALNRL